jgi:hypothetical protein
VTECALPANFAIKVICYSYSAWALGPIHRQFKSAPDEKTAIARAIEEYQVPAISATG